MHKKLAAILLILTIPLTGCGCWSLVEINNTAIVAGLGVDLLDDGSLQFITQCENAVISEESGPTQKENLVITTTGDTLTQAARNTTLYLPRIPLWSHASSLVIGENLARTDLALIADFFLRNRNVRMDSDIFLAHNTPLEQIFAANDPLIGGSTRNLEELLRIEEFTLGHYVPVSIAEFLFKLATPGVDPVLPMLAVVQTENSQAMQLQGIAVFKDRRMAGYLNEIESRGYRWLNPAKNMGGLLAVDMPEEKGRVTFEVVNFNAEQTPRLQDGQIVMDIKVQTAINFYEQQGNAELVGIKQRQELEIAAARQIKKEIQACIKKSQSLNSDVLGWGRSIYWHHPAEWEKIQDNWEGLYPQTSANIRVSCRVDRTYLTTRSFEFK